MSAINVALHKGQRKVFNDPHRFRVLVCGRRFGKSSLVLWELLIRSLTYQGDIRTELMPATVMGVMPTMNQARQILWQPLLRLITNHKLGGAIEKVNHTDCTIWMKGGKPPIKIRGANDHGGDRLRGSRLYFVALDEYQDIRPVVFDEVVEPAMKDTPGSRAIFTGTPKGKLNHFYALAQKAETDKDFAFFNMPTWTNPCIPKEEVEKSRLVLPPRVFRQEYLATWESFPGKIYSELDSTNITYDAPSRFDHVTMGIDWGSYHPAAAVLGVKQGIWYFLEGWSPGGKRDSQPVPSKVVDANVVRLARKWNVASCFCDPAQAADILRMRELGARYAQKGLQRAVAGYNKIEEGISQVHGLIHQKQLLFVPDMQDSVEDSIDGNLGYHLLEAYHYLLDKDGNVRDDTPADGYESHINDAVRYALVKKLPT